MSRLVRIVFVVAAIAAVGWGGKWLLIDWSPVPEISSFELDLDEVRRLAQSVAGPLPVRIESELVAEAEFPSFAVVAGRGAEPHRMVYVAYQIVFPAGTVILDSAQDRSSFEATGRGVRFDEASFEKVQRSMRRAGTILITHEHADHLGGIAASRHLKEILPRVLLTREQLANEAALDRVALPQEARQALTPLDYDRYHVVSPGIVLIKAPSHTPGTQIVYVGLQDGTEFLFVGDIAWHMDNLRELTGRPLLVSRFFIGEDRNAVLGQLRTLHDLMETEPVQIVVSHDGDQLEEHVAAGRIAPAFR